jgi:hypothetical protein
LALGAQPRFSERLSPGLVAGFDRTGLAASDQSDPAVAVFDQVFDGEPCPGGEVGTDGEEAGHRLGVVQEDHRRHCPVVALQPPRGEFGARQQRGDQQSSRPASRANRAAQQSW